MCAGPKPPSPYAAHVLCTQPQTRYFIQVLYPQKHKFFIRNSMNKAKLQNEVMLSNRFPFIIDLGGGNARLSSSMQKRGIYTYVVVLSALN